MRILYDKNSLLASHLILMLYLIADVDINIYCITCQHFCHYKMLESAMSGKTQAGNAKAVRSATVQPDCHSPSGVRSGEASLMRGETSLRIQAHRLLRVEHSNCDDRRSAELQTLKTGEAAVRGTMEPDSKSKSIRVCVMVLTLLVEEPVPIWCSWSLRR